MMDIGEQHQTIQQSIDVNKCDDQQAVDTCIAINGNSSTQKVYDNVIVGGGPDGINMALEFTVRRILYVLLERSSNFGGQFRVLPRCGQLISLNKKHLPENNPGWLYARRYDWHSLSTITEEDSKKDPKLLFTNWTDNLFPTAKCFVEYLEYVGNHANWRVVDHSRFNCQVAGVTSNDSNVFLIATTGGETFMAQRLFIATGTSRPIVPLIHGILEHGTFYHDFNPTEIECYRNKSIVILGSGNSAFEVAHSLLAFAGDILIVPRSGIKFAHQTHNVLDVRLQTSVAFDLAQLKSLTTINNERFTEIKRHQDGRLLLTTCTPEPHWQTPMWRKRDVLADHVIVCCGFEYTVSDLFTTERMIPELDPTGKYCMLTSTWESTNVKNLYFVGGSMRVNDFHAASGSIHGFRYNIQALASVIAERYYEQPLVPIFQCSVDPKCDETFEPLTQFLVHIVSSSASLFELFNYACCTITFQTVSEQSPANTPMYQAEVWEVLPREYARQRWAGNCTWVGRVEVLFQYGFHLYGENISTYHFNHPTDNFNPDMSVLIHPVFHAFRHGNEDIGKYSDCPGKIEEWHLQESRVVRWDEDDYKDESTNVHQYTNSIYNALAAALGMPNRKSTLPVYDEFIDHAYVPMTSDEVEQALQREPGLRWMMEGKAKRATSMPMNNVIMAHGSSPTNVKFSD